MELASSSEQVTLQSHTCLSASVHIQLHVNVLSVLNTTQSEQVEHLVNTPVVEKHLLVFRDSLFSLFIF